MSTLFKNQWPTNKTTEKCRLVIIAAILAVLASTSFAQDAYISNLKIQSALIDRYRIMNGRFYDLKLLADWLSPDNNISAMSGRPMPEWSFVTGKIIQIVDKKTILLSIEDSGNDYHTVRLEGYPYSDVHVDGDEISVFAVHNSKNFSYTTVQGATATIENYYYGKVPNSLELQENLLRLNNRYPTNTDEGRLSQLMADRLAVENEYVKDKIDKDSAAKKLMEMDVEIQALEKKVAQTAKDRQDRQKEAVKIKVVEFKKTQASNNVAYAQYDLGKLYLTGDGVESNRDLALYWINRAATNGYKDAEVFLKSTK